MAETPPSLDLLCELSAHERRLAENPDAHGYLKLASGYAEAGWIKEATRAAQRAKALAQGGEVERPEATVLSGPCTPKVLLEIVRSMTLTGRRAICNWMRRAASACPWAWSTGAWWGRSRPTRLRARRRFFGRRPSAPAATRSSPGR